MKKTGLKKILLALIAMGLLSSCGQALIPADKDGIPENDVVIEEPGDKEPAEDQEESQEQNKEEPAEAPGKEQQEPGSEEPQAPEVDFKALKVNELGEIMILMYHDIGSEESDWVRTPENFRKDLETLYEKGYRSISMKDYLNNNINVPAGTTPVVIVFDDSTQGQFNILEEEGEFVIDPNCAVGILEEFYKEHPDFGLEATFYIYYPVPFRQKDLIEKKLRYIVEKGMDIGSHSYNHDNLRTDPETGQPRDAASIQKVLAMHVKKTKEILPDYEVDSLALPYGASPKGDLYQYVVQGSYEGVEYHHKGVLLVGANPAKPLYHKDADPSRIPRVRASEMNTEGLGLYDWLERFDKNPERRFISDGDPNTIAFPKGKEDLLKADEIEGKTVIAYE